MHNRRSLSIDCIVSAALAVLLLAALGSAHTGSEYYGKKWRYGERNQNYGFASGVPEGAFRDRVQNGAQTWKVLAGNMEFFRGGVDVNWNYEDACNGAGKNSIHYGSIDGPPVDGEVNKAGQVRHCVYESDQALLALFRMRFDSADPWYTGTSTPGANQIDLQSLATHEFGHATGWGSGAGTMHFPETWGVCVNSPKHTMCPSIPEGKDYWRSLEEHDKDTFNNVYN